MMHSDNVTNKRSKGRRKNDDEKFLLICNKLTREHLLMSEFDLVPANFDVVKKIAGISCYAVDGNVKKEFSHFPKFDYVANKICEDHYFATVNLLSLTRHKELTLIKRFGTNELFLWLKKKPTPIGFVLVRELKGKSVFFDGILRKNHLRNPLHPDLLKGEH